MKNYNLTKTQKQYFSNNFQSRTYGSRITEYIPHESGTFMFPTSISQIFTIVNPPFIQTSQLSETRMILYKNGYLELKGFQAKSIQSFSHFLENVEFIFFEPQLFENDKESNQPFCLSYFSYHQKCLVATIQKTVLPSSTQTWQLKFGSSISPRSRTELVSISPSLFVTRAGDNMRDIFTVSHRFNSNGKTFKVKFCRYAPIDENEFVVNFYQSSYITFKKQTLSIDDFFQQIIDYNQGSYAKYL